MVDIGFRCDFVVDAVEDYFANLAYSDLVRLISWQVGLLAKFGLWSLRVMKASLFAVMSTLSSMPSFVAILLSTE